MFKSDWKLAAFVVVVLAWYLFTRRASNSETFRGKNVVICGGSSGIGEQIAYRFCEQGANVLVVARREWALKKVVENCSRLGAASAGYMTADLQGGGNDNRLLLKVSGINNFTMIFHLGFIIISRYPKY